MKNIHLTKREYAIMKILWDSDKPMLVSEITPLTKNISVNSMHPLIRNLIEKGFIKVVGNVKVTKAPSRLYTAAIPVSEYAMLKAAEIFSTNNRAFNMQEFLHYLMKKYKDYTLIDEMEEFIQNYKEQNPMNN